MSALVNDTIFALSSGAPPAAIAVVRISGAEAGAALKALAGTLPEPRRASLRTLRDNSGEQLDQALVLWMPGRSTATGEDLAELHLHGGRAVVAAVEAALLAQPGLRPAQAGEFTRRAFANGRIDLAEAEGLADLLTAETQLQRRAALSIASGRLSEKLNRWRDDVLSASAAVEAVLDFAEEDDVAELPPTFFMRLVRLREELGELMDGPRAEALREGYRVALGGPPNSGKSSLFNALVDDEAAIVTPIAGTTRDVLAKPVAIDGVPFLISDTAGLRQDVSDTVEAIGISRAHDEFARADLVLWLGEEGRAASGLPVWEIESFSDLPRTPIKRSPRHRLSARTGAGLAELRRDLIATARAAMPGASSVAINERQRRLIGMAADGIDDATRRADPLLIAEGLRSARASFDRLLGRAATEDMLDALFGRFCIGK